MTGLLEPVIKETYLGRAQIRKIFKIPKVGVIAGCYVLDGKITRNAEIRVVRNKEIIHQRPDLLAQACQRERDRGQERLRMRHRPGPI